MPQPENTATMGSSMGGLYSFQLLWKFPDTFSMAGCLSPAFFKSASPIYRRIAENKDSPPDGKIYMDAGEMKPEFARCIPRMHKNLLKLEFEEGNNLFFWVVLGESHSESAWSRRLHIPLLFFFIILAFVRVIVFSCVRKVFSLDFPALTHVLHFLPVLFCPLRGFPAGSTACPT